MPYTHAPPRRSAQFRFGSPGFLTRVGPQPMQDARSVIEPVTLLSRLRKSACSDGEASASLVERPAAEAKHAQSFSVKDHPVKVRPKVRFLVQTASALGRRRVFCRRPLGA